MDEINLKISSSFEFRKIAEFSFYVVLFHIYKPDLNCSVSAGKNVVVCGKHWNNFQLTSSTEQLPTLQIQTVCLFL